jgi:uncharacterized membrane protein
MIVMIFAKLCWLVTAILAVVGVFALFSGVSAVEVAMALLVLAIFSHAISQIPRATEAESELIARLEQLRVIGVQLHVVASRLVQKKDDDDLEMPF